MRPISLRIRHAAILNEAHAALVRGGREQELKQAHNTRIMQRAHGIAAQARERQQARRRAKASALRALVVVHRAYSEMVVSTTASDEKYWRQAQEQVERALREIIARST
jgi:hypothetical protein